MRHLSDLSEYRTNLEAVMSTTKEPLPKATPFDAQAAQAREQEIEKLQRRQEIRNNQRPELV